MRVLIKRQRRRRLVLPLLQERFDLPAQTAFRSSADLLCGPPAIAPLAASSAVPVIAVATVRPSPSVLPDSGRRSEREASTGGR